MTEAKKLNKQMQEEERLFKPLKDLNLIDDFLFDVTTTDLEACKIIIELSLGRRARRWSATCLESAESGWISVWRMGKETSLM